MKSVHVLVIVVNTFIIISRTYTYIEFRKTQVCEQK